MASALVATRLCSAARARRIAGLPGQSCSSRSVSEILKCCDPFAIVCNLRHEEAPLVSQLVRFDVAYVIRVTFDPAEVGLVESS